MNAYVSQNGGHWDPMREAAVRVAGPQMGAASHDKIAAGEVFMEQTG